MKKRTIITGFVLLISALSITNGSLWGDEICRVVAPISGDLKATLHTALGYAQPGYMLYMLLWANLVGSTEFLLRCSNLIFVVIAIMYAMKIVDAKGWPICYTFAFFLHPMFIYYMDEATPYIVVYALALAFTYHIFCVEDFHSVRNIVCINIIYFIGVFMHFMFGFILMFYITKCILCRRKESIKLRRHIGIMLCFSPLYLPLLYLYVAKLNKTQTGFGLKSILYIVYSFLGLQGAGLSRNDLRAGNFTNLQMWQVIFLLLFVASLVLILCFAVRELKDFFARNRGMILSALVFFCIICLVAGAVDLGLWERHCMTAFPVYIICACDLFSAVYKRSKCGRAIIVLYLILLMGSCLNIRLNYYYACDDHKGAAQRMREWIADEDAVLLTTIGEDGYYPVRQAAEAPEKQIVYLQKKTDEQIIEEMEGLSGEAGTSERRKVMLVLFEKNCSKYLYTYFDSKEGYKTDNSYNSYKLVTVADGRTS